MPELPSREIFGAERGNRRRRVRDVPGRALLHFCRRKLIRCVRTLPGGVCATGGRPHVLFAMPARTVWQRDGHAAVPRVRRRQGQRGSKRELVHRLRRRPIVRFGRQCQVHVVHSRTVPKPDGPEFMRALRGKYVLSRPKPHNAVRRVRGWPHSNEFRQHDLQRLPGRQAR